MIGAINYFLDDSDGNQWICMGNQLLFRKPSESTWTEKTDLPGRPVSSIVETDGYHWIENWNNISGRSAETRFDRTDWVSFESTPQQFTRTMWDNSVVKGLHNRFRWLIQSNLLTIATPYRMTVKDARLDHNGKLWIVNERKELLTYQSDGIPPETFLDLIVTNVTTGDLLPLNLAGVERYIPRESIRPFSFSFRIGGTPWSEFLPLHRVSGISSDTLEIGNHRLEVRARDEAGNVDLTPATLAFNVLPIPLQDRAWFAPSILVLGSIYVMLATYGLFAWRRLTGANERLEAKVKGRTQALADDVALRKKIEAELRRNEAELEFRVESRTQDLKIANKELESFSYTVSHDLKAPLRNISGFCSILESSLAKGNESAIQNALFRLKDSSVRMGQLIDDLLQLSRVSRAPMKLVNVDLAKIAGEITAELSQSDSERNVKWSLPTKCVVVADRGLIRSVLQNLLENSWKYTENKLVAEITFEEQTIDGARTFVVSDNGEGFNMKYVDKLFKPFQRLHSQTEFKGEGIGLATVRRIVERHHGNVWTESELGKGATFYFTLRGNDFEHPKRV